jgi:hypothetical protein
MAKDRRYNAVKSMMEVNNISNFKEIFDIIPKTLVSKDMGMNYQTFTRKVEGPDQFTIRELISLSELFEVLPDALFRRILSDIPVSKKKGK